MNAPITEASVQSIPQKFTPTGARFVLSERLVSSLCSKDPNESETRTNENDCIAARISAFWKRAFARVAQAMNSFSLSLLAIPFTALSSLANPIITQQPTNQILVNG